MGHTVTASEHLRFMRSVLTASGASPADALTVAEGLLWADQRGRQGQGLLRLPILVRRMAQGLIRSPAPMDWTHLGPAAARLNAADGFGHVAGRAGMARAIDLAKSQAIGLVAVRRSIHYGAAAYYCAQAAEAGCIGLTVTNAFAKVAPFGGTQPVLGTNPLAFGCPTASGAPVLVDLATSEVAGSEVRLADGADAALPPGAALDASGKPTRDPGATSCLLPAAGHKGFALGLMVEILSGVLTGASFGKDVGSLFHTWDRPVDVGHIFIAIDIARLMPMDVFLHRLGALLDGVKQSPSQEGAEPIRIPGELRARYAQEYAKQGIPLSPAMARVRDELAAELNLEKP